jgi:hypothetical protein
MSMTVNIAMQGITDLEILLTALHEMGIRTIRSNSENRQRKSNLLAWADIYAQRVKFVRHQSGEIEMVGDSDWRVMRDERFKKRLQQQYSLEAVKKKVIELNYDVASVERIENGAIKLVARAWR